MTARVTDVSGVIASFVTNVVESSHKRVKPSKIGWRRPVSHPH